METGLELKAQGGARPFWGPLKREHLPKWPSVCLGTKAIAANLKGHQGHFQTLKGHKDHCCQK